MDEISRLAPFEQILDAIGGSIIGRNSSIGIAQVKIDTANDLIKKELYNPNPEDTKLPFKKLTSASRSYLYTYLIQPRHNIFFAAAFIRSIIDYWASKTDLTVRPEIIGTLYSQGYGVPKTEPQATPRGTQIVNEFYPLAKRWLQEL